MLSLWHVQVVGEGEKEGLSTGELCGKSTLQTLDIGEWFSPMTSKFLSPENPPEIQNGE